MAKARHSTLDDVTVAPETVKRPMNEAIKLLQEMGHMKAAKLLQTDLAAFKNSAK